MEDGSTGRVWKRRKDVFLVLVLALVLLVEDDDACWALFVAAAAAAATAAATDDPSSAAEDESSAITVGERMANATTAVAAANVTMVDVIFLAVGRRSRRRSWRRHDEC